MIGRLYRELNDLDGTFQVYERLVQNFSASYAGHFFLGKIHAECGDLGKAEKEFIKTLELAPDLEEYLERRIPARYARSRSAASISPRRLQPLNVSRSRFAIAPSRASFGASGAR